MQTEVKIALIGTDIDFLLTENELDNINELCVALKPLKLAINPLSIRDTDLLYSEIVIEFTKKNLMKLNHPKYTHTTSIIELLKEETLLQFIL